MRARRARPLGLDLELDPLVGLDVQDEPIRIDVAHRRPIEEDQRRPPELEHDLRAAAGQPLPGPQIERHAGPAPVLHEQLQRRVRLGRRGRRDLGLPTIGPDWPALDLALAVLAADRPVEDLLRAHRPDRLEHLHLLVPDRVGRERDRRLHRDEREELEHVVLDHVTQHARRLVVVASLLDAHRLPRRSAGRGRRTSGSRSARADCSRSGRPGCSGRSPSRGSDRSGRSAPREGPRPARR